MKQNDLLTRNFLFGVNGLKFLRTLPNDPESKLIRFQLGKSATSIGQIMKNHKQDLRKLILKIR